jgi:hypothetical protein
MKVGRPTRNLIHKEIKNLPLKGKEQEHRVETFTKMDSTILHSKIPRLVRQRSNFHLLKKKGEKMRRTLTDLSWSLLVRKKTKEK